MTHIDEIIVLATLLDYSVIKKENTFDMTYSFINDEVHYFLRFNYSDYRIVITRIRTIVTDRINNEKLDSKKLGITHVLQQLKELL